MADYTAEVPGQPLVLPPQFPDLAAPGALEQIGAGLQLENTVVAGLSQGTIPPPEEQPFKSEWDVRDVVSFDEFMTGQFDSARDDRQVEAIRANRRREQQLRDTLGKGPLSPLVVGLFAAGVDPFSYIGPFAAPFRALGVGGRVLAGGADAALSIGASEIILSNQQLRSGSDALASMVLGTVFGAGVSAALVRGTPNGGFGDALSPTPKYESARAELSAYLEALAKDEGSLARVMDTTAVGRFLDSPTLKWTFERNPPPPGVIDDANLLRFAMGRNTRLFDAVEAAARKLEELDNPLNLAIARTASDLTPSRIERDGIISQIIDLEGRANPAAQTARAEGKSLDEVMAAMDAAPSARKDPVAVTQAAALRQRLRELDDVLPLRVADESTAPLAWQVDKARAAAVKEYEDALGRLHAQLEKERAKAAKLTQALGKEGTLEAHGRIMELQDALARGVDEPMPKANWLDEIAAFNRKKLIETEANKNKNLIDTFDAKAEKAAQPKGDTVDKAPVKAQAKGENIDFFGLCGGI